MNRNQKIISVFSLGILWGIAEIIVGDLIQTLALPIRGIILTFVSIFFIITAKRLAKFSGSVLLLGFIAVILKAVYYQNIFHSALLAVVLLVILAELSLLIFKDFKNATLITGMLLMLYTYFHCIIMHSYYYGRNILTVYENLVYGSWGIDISVELILILFFLINLLFGAIAGILVYRWSEKIEKFALTVF
ncbi:MAG: hypothetical protein JW995_06005 [Melioribacteraceae bacterium]|nr:hypothetical protein [Melioribacteraceae bacterium]